MQAASRESYTAVLDRLNSSSRKAKAAAVRKIADGLLAVAAVLRTEPRLRRALADPARAGADRAELLRSLLDGKISPEALDLAAGLVEGRWSLPSELLDATELLGVEALLASAERADTLGDVEDELFRFGQVVSGDNALAATLADTSATVARRAELVRSLLDGKADPVTVRLAELAVAGFGGRGLEGSLSRLTELAAGRQDRQVAYVTVASPLTDADEERLADDLGQMYGRRISVKLSVKPDVLGGVSVQIGHDLYDGTVSRRLDAARTALTGR